MISKETAIDIAFAYREIEAAERLLADITEELKRGRLPDIRDAFGRLQGGLQLGVPSGQTGQRLFNVQWSLAKPVLEAHIADYKSRIAALNEKAKIEASASTGKTPSTPGSGCS